MAVVRDVAIAPGIGTAAPTKLIIAVHGAGNQIGYETVQSVAARVGAYYGVAPALPLGRFYAANAAGDQVQPRPQLMVDPPDPARLAALKLGFAEVYWAPIAREVVARGHILEDTKKWVRTISARIAAHGVKNRGWQRRDVDRLVTVVDQLAHAVFVLERLTLVADKAGLFTFDLARLLVDFAGDVQIVADFESYRQQILDTFDRVMTSSLSLSPNATPDPCTQLFIVAHSEGSVIAFLSLLHALNAPRRYPWIHNVCGLMTIGSPIEIHHLMWPELWRDRRPPLARLTPSPLVAGRPPIPWHNYIDDGDPIAYELEATTQWLAESGFGAHFAFKEITFSRAYLPGKAHVDYWHDEAVFGHFIAAVVHPDAAEHAQFTSAPPDRILARSICWLVPQLLLAALLMVAVYLLYRPVAAALGATPAPLSVARDVTGIALLLLGVTAAARIPRIMDHARWWTLSGVLLIASMAFYANVTCPVTQLGIGGSVAQAFALPDIPIRLAAIADRLPGCASVPPGSDTGASALALLLLAGVVAAVSGVAVHLNPRRGGLALPLFGVLATTCLIATILMSSGRQRDVEVWPVVLAAAAFFYLWWLTALLFDLAFVWQHYIRQSAVTARLRWLAAA